MPGLTRIVRSPLSTGIAKCAECGLCFLDPMPSPEEIRSYYAKGQFADSYAGEYVMGEVAARNFADDRLARIETLLGRPGKILDIGAAQGAFLALARNRGWAVEGIELDSAAAEKARSRHQLQLHTRDLHEIGFPNAAFDAVHMSHVLEHLLDPKATLAEIHRILRPGGVVVIEVPNELGDLFTSIQTTVLRRPQLPYEVPEPHTFFFSARTLSRLVSAAGFKSVDVRTLRRNAEVVSRIPLGSVAKRLVYAAEEIFKKGPIIEVLAQA